MKANGFTLVELLVSLLIFGMLSAAAVGLLTVSVRAQDMATERLDRLAEIRRFGAIVTADLAQAAPRVPRDQAGVPQRAFEGGTGQAEGVSIVLVRGGWENHDGSNRSSLQKVEYRLSGGRLERTPHRFVDGAAPLPPVALLEGVLSLRLRYRDRRGEWRDRWDPTLPGELPRAVDMVVDLEGTGQLRQVFLVGAGA